MYKINHSSVSTEKLDFYTLDPYYKTGYVPCILNLSILERCNFINNSTAIIHKSIVEKTGAFTDCHYIDIPLVIIQCQ